MAKFKYTMQNILDVKYKLEDQAKTAYSVAQANLNEGERVLDVLYDRRVSYENELRVKIQTTINILDIKSLKEAILSMDEAIIFQKRKIKQLEDKLEQARLKLSDVMVDRKTHEKLKENEFQVFLRELEEEEKKEIDQLVSYQYNKPMDNREDI